MKNSALTTIRETVSDLRKKNRRKGKRRKRGVALKSVYNE